ncbi:uncharacterized protein Dana_GF22828 [Drosophila ananassae]|uniref:Spaetzle domain-containing protein n=1 Tax=Drosophila ananassae TaxID=7217 RepID=B3MV06_DROAN|nr:protein spaetzle 3 [Drosophila ananassae]EDV33071.2 uncharacterized protein Dana_GF22828 [Drosophila ananassae]
MALTNFSLPFGALGQQPWGVTLAPLHPIHQLASNTNNLLYSPADHQQQSPAEAAGNPPDYFKNNPYAPPQAAAAAGGYQYQNSGGRHKQNNAYLPPTAPNAVRNSVYHIQQVQQVQQSQQQHQHQQITQQQQQQQDQNENSVSFQSTSSRSSSSSGQSSIQLTQTHSSGRGPGEGSYTRFPGQPPQQQQKQFYNAHGSASATFTKNTGSFSITSYGSRQQPQHQQQQPPSQQQQPPPAPPQPQQRSRPSKPEAPQPAQTYGVAPPENYPERAPGFTRVQAGQGSRTQVHAVIDYDVEEGEEDEEEDDEEVGPNKDSNQMPTVTPIQGPIYLKNGTVPVVPLFSYPKLNNGSFLQIPIWWTALSVALGLDVRGDVIKGVPCIKRYHQLFCPTAGNSYPIEKIERFIDDNKALMRRMYGDFEMNMEGPAGGGGGRQQAKVRKRRFIDEPDIFIPPGAFAANAGETVEAGDSYFGKLRNKRQAAAGGSRNRGGSAGGGSNSNGNSNVNRPQGNGNSGTGRLDACESKIEIVTPYWASNSAGKIRAIVNTQHFEQAIHQEVCSNTQTPRCEGECGCEQKYKWHRLLAYDPDNDCKGIFMDWFLFPSCCVCRCNP